MTRSIALKRDLILRIADRSAQLLVIAEAAYFARACRMGRSMSRRDYERAQMARVSAWWWAESLADDVEAMRAVGLAGAALDLAKETGRKIREARDAHCRAEGLDARLAQLIAPACDEPPHKRGW